MKQPDTSDHLQHSSIVPKQFIVEGPGPGRCARMQLRGVRRGCWLSPSVSFPLLPLGRRSRVPRLMYGSSATRLQLRKAALCGLAGCSTMVADMIAGTGAPCLKGRSFEVTCVATDALGKRYRSWSSPGLFCPLAHFSNIKESYHSGIVA